jgi:glycosyltransferase involved in cell wall biosynthesis
MSDSARLPSTFTAIVIAKNEASMIESCLACLQWCQEILVIDNGSTDQTAELAEKYGAKVIAIAHDSFAKLRTEAIKRVKTDWMIYVDADERVSPNLAKEILVQVETQPTISALSIPRNNIFYGHEMTAGGWQNDVLPRAFKASTLTEWQGMVHESPIFTGSTVQLTQPLWHFSHRNTTDGLLKTADWTKIEAKLLFEAGLPTVTILQIIRKGCMEFWRRAVLWKGYRDGAVGWIEAIVQGLNKVLIYIQVWELQQKPQLSQVYEQWDKKLLRQWQDQTDLPKRG